MKLLRLFYAVEPDRQFVHQLNSLILELSRSVPNISWIPALKSHITLQFLGDTPESQLPILSEICHEVAQKFHAFEFSVDRVGAFPNSSRPNVLWVGSSKKNHEFNRLHAALQQSLGVEDRRSFMPHITLARLKSQDGVPFAMQIASKFSAIYSVSNVKLFRSYLEPSGARYEPLAEATLL